MQVMTDKSEKYWYFISVIECPVCGDIETFKERKYTPKPEDSAERHSYEQKYDWCEL